MYVLSWISQYFALVHVIFNSLHISTVVHLCFVFILSDTCTTVTYGFCMYFSQYLRTVGHLLVMTETVPLNHHLRMYQGKYEFN